MHYQLVCDEPTSSDLIELTIGLPDSWGAERIIVHLLDGTGQSRFNDTYDVIANSLELRGIGTCRQALHERAAHQRLFDGSSNSDGEREGMGACRVFNYLRKDARFANSKFCILASGDGASPALYAATCASAQISAIAISGGRLSSALTVAAKNTLPTLFLIGSNDNVARSSCRAAYAAARGPKELVLIDGAGHLLREPGAPEEVASRSAAWFQRYSFFDI
ncbi:MAG: hypothetical protein U0136_18890 [Bdellovibrionota bacterium]